MGQETSLKIFVNEFDKSLPSIKFADEISQTGTDFSDATGFKVGNKLKTIFIVTLNIQILVKIV